MSKHDISNPAHYTRSSIEPIAVIEAWGLGFHLGNAVKYIARAGFKAGAEPIDDLSKAIWYLERARENLQAAPKLATPVYSCTFPTDDVSRGLRELASAAFAQHQHNCNRLPTLGRDRWDCAPGCRMAGVVQLDLSDVEDR